MRLIELIAADSRTGDIRPLQIRFPEPLTANQYTEDYVSQSFQDVVISRRIILTSVLASPLPESRSMRVRIASALAGAVPAEFRDAAETPLSVSVPGELLFRLASANVRIASTGSAPGDSAVEAAVARQVFERAMFTLLGTADWRAQLAELPAQQD